MIVWQSPRTQERVHHRRKWQRIEKSAPRKLYGHFLILPNDSHQRYSNEWSFHRKPSMTVIDNDTLNRVMSQERRSKSRLKDIHYPVVGDFYEKKKQIEQSLQKQQQIVLKFDEKRQHHSYSKRQSQDGKRKRNDYFEQLSSLTKSKLGELLLTVAEQELLIERQR